MKKCLKCECIYPDYYEKCPVCQSTEKKEWKQAGKKISDHEKEKDNRCLNIEEGAEIDDLLQEENGF